MEWSIVFTHGGVCTGNGVTGCTRGDCISLRHEQCPDHRACYDSTCVGKVLYIHIQYISYYYKQSIEQTPVVQHSVVEDHAAIQLPTVEV